MEITIRPAISDDTGTLARLHSHLHDLHVTGDPRHFKPLDPENIALWFQELIGKPESQIWLAEKEGLPVGYIVAVRREREENPFCYGRRWIELDQVAVSPEWQRQGVGRALVRHAIEAVGSEGFSDVELTAWSFNVEAVNAFQGLGFVPKYSRYIRSGEPKGEHEPQG